MKTTVWFEKSKLTSSYSVRWYDPETGAKKRIFCGSFSEAQQKKAEIRLMLRDRRGGSGTPNASPLDTFNRYIESLAMTHRASTIKLKTFALARFLESIPSMSRLIPSEIEHWKNSMLMFNKYKIDTVSIRLRELRTFIRWCVKKGVLKVDPMTGIEIPASTFVGRRISDAELSKIFSLSSDEFKPFFVLAVETGARKGEILSMEWQEVSLSNHSWYIPKEKCKTKHERTIPLTDTAVTALRWLLPPNQPPPERGQVFASWTPWKVKYYWTKVLKDAKIEGRVRIHDIRHTFASNWNGRAGSLKAICGWRTDQMMSHYTHLELEHLKSDINQFGGSLGVILGRSSRAADSKSNDSTNEQK